MTHRPNKRSAAVRRTPNYGGQPSPEKAKRGSRTCWLLGWRASRSSGVSRAKAGGEGSRTPVIPNLVHGLPHTSRKGLNKGFGQNAEVGGFSWKLPAWPV